MLFFRSLSLPKIKEIMSLNSYILSKRFYQTLEQNPAMQLGCKPSHIAVYFRMIEIQNQIGWHFKIIGLPTEAVMQYACISSARTYYKVLEDLESWGLFVTKSYAVNQFTSRKVSFYLENEQECAPKVSTQNPKVQAEKAKEQPKKPKCKPKNVKNSPKSLKNKPKSDKDTTTVTKSKSKSVQTKCASEKYIKEYFGSKEQVEKNTASYLKLRQNWQKAKAEGRLKDLAAIESAGFKLQSEIGLKVSPIEELLSTFLQSRSAKGKPVSAFVFQKLLKDLEQFSGQNIQVASEILEKSILQGWGWIYPLKNNSQSLKTQAKIPTDDYQRYCSNPKIYKYSPPSRKETFASVKNT